MSISPFPARHRAAPPISLIVGAVAGLAITPFLAAAVGLLASNVYGLDLADDRLVVGLPVLVFSILVVVAAPCTRIPRLVRLVLAAAMIQVGLAMAAFALWMQPVNPIRMVVSLPLEPSLMWSMIATAALLTAALAHQSFRMRRGCPLWLSRVVVFSMANLFVLGLMLPHFASQWPSGFDPHPWRQMVTANFGAVLVAAVVPALIALMISILRPAALSTNSAGLMSLIGTAVLAGMVVRAEPTMIAEQIYAEFVPLLIGCALFALGSIVSLAVCQWRELAFHRSDAQRPDPWVQYGVVVGFDNEPTGTVIGSVTFRGWLRGFTSQLGRFRIRSQSGESLDVPPGSMLSLPLGASSIRARLGASAGSVRVGDPVAAAGYESPMSDGAYRKSPIPVASSDGVIVYGAGEHRIIDSLAFLLWRPCVLFLLATSAVALPGLVGLPF